MVRVRSLFAIVTVFIIVGLLWLLIKVTQSNNKFKREVVRPIIYGIPALLSYMLFILNTTNIYLAYLFDSIFFALTDFLALSMMIFVIDYVYDKHVHWTKYIFFYTCCCIDTVSLLLNIKFQHMFTLSPCVSYFSHYSLFYWSKNFYISHYVHLLYCYIMVSVSSILLIYKTVKAPLFYKSKYSHILISYVVVILSNAFCYVADAPIDFSVLLYAILAGLISYFSVYSTPKIIIFKTLRKFYGSIDDALVFYDIDGKCIYANRVAREIFSSSSSFSYDKVEKYRDDWLLEHDDSAINTTVLTDSETFLINNSERKFVVEYQKLYYSSRMILIGFYFKFQDKTDEINGFMRERFFATHDSLTGVYNREYFFECVDHKIENLAKLNETTSYMMLCSNIKDFKLVNELFGQDIGDEVLKKQAELLRKLCSKHNIYGRINDDKFALFMRKEDFDPMLFKSSISTMRKLAENSTYSLHVMIGVCEVYSEKETAQGLYDKAKMAIDAVGDDFQHIFAYYDSNLMERILMEKNILNDLDIGLSQQQFVPYLQPLVKQDGSLCGAEILVRWNHPVKGMLNPEYFIPVLEKSSVIQKLDLYIWEKSISLLSEWSDKDLFFGLNVSPRDMFYLDIDLALRKLCDKYKVSPQRICVEFPEQVLTDDISKTVLLFDNLHKSGFKVAIDKFGSGYSSLNLLKDVSVDVLKTDLTFMEDSESEKRNSIILESIFSMSKELGIQVVALGVENHDEFELLKKLGGNIFQGHYFSKALDKKDFSIKYL